MGGIDRVAVFFLGGIVFGRHRDGERRTRTALVGITKGTSWCPCRRLSLPLHVHRRRRPSSPHATELIRRSTARPPLTRTLYDFRSEFLATEHLHPFWSSHFRTSSDVGCELSLQS